MWQNQKNLLLARTLHTKGEQTSLSRPCCSGAFPNHHRLRIRSTPIFNPPFHGNAEAAKTTPGRNLTADKNEAIRTHDPGDDGDRFRLYREGQLDGVIALGECRAP
jgi:hypothetical protein